MVENSLFNPDFTFIIVFLILCIIGVIYFSVLTYRQRRKSFELTINSKEELLKKINLYLIKIGYHLESDKENLVSYKKYFTRIGITIDKDKAILTGQAYIIQRLIDKYNENK